MDKIMKYQSIISEVLREYASVKKTLTPDVKSQVVLDPINHQYQLLSVGWHGQKYIYTTAFHFAIQEGKIWIYQNNTDAMIADDLMERGVPQSDIVLGFVAPSARVYSGFAVA
jgi:hypothetical protein